MSVNVAFLQAILEAPDDDAPRLIFADWLDEQGDSRRAEFIRLQCALARMSEDDSTRVGMQRREQDLLSAHQEAWGEPIRAMVFGWEFRRGFVERVTTTAHRFLKFGEALFRLAPVQHLRLTYVKDRQQKVAASPHLARLKSLDVSDGAVRGGEAWVLAASPHLTSLTALCLSRLQISNLEAERLARISPPPRLQILDLSANWIGDSGAKALATSPLGRRLTVLNLRGNRIGDAGARALAAAPQLAGLHALYLEGNRFRTNSEEGLRARFGERVHF
jgi:uncharacterized protein (TIGR02996 family)